MKTTFLKATALLAFLSLAICCKNDTEMHESKASAETAATAEMSSDAAVHNNKTERKFVRTADARFEVENVRQATYAIENATAEFGGFVAYTNLQSNILERNETRISQDSTLQTIKYKVDNHVTIRVPNTQLDTVLRTIGRQIKFLDYRVIKADDVALQLLAAKMASQRNKTAAQRLEKAIDTKGRKLASVTAAEDKLDLKKQDDDTTTLNALALKDQVDFSTITLEIYQRETVLNQVVANEASIDAYRPHIGLRIADGLKTGWYFLEGVIAFVAQLWSVALILFIAMFLYRKYTAKRT